jgi:hypothetical protein
LLITVILTLLRDHAFAIEERRVFSISFSLVLGGEGWDEGRIADKLICVNERMLIDVAQITHGHIKTVILNSPKD